MVYTNIGAIQRLLGSGKDGKTKFKLGVALAEEVVTLINASREQEAQDLARLLIGFYALHDKEFEFISTVFHKEIQKGASCGTPVATNPFHHP